MGKQTAKKKRQIPFYYQIIFFPTIFLVLLGASVGIIYSKERAYCFKNQDETGENLKESIDSTFKSMTSSITYFFSGTSFQEHALEYRQDSSLYEPILDDLDFFLTTNSMFSPSVLYYPCDDSDDSIDSSSFLSIDVDYNIKDFNFSSLKNAANEKMSSRSGAIFYQPIHFIDGTSQTPFFALGRNVISGLSTSETYYKRIGVVFVLFHRTVVNNLLETVSQIQGLDAMIHTDNDVIFSSDDGATSSVLSDSSFRHNSLKLNFAEWYLDVYFNNGQIIQNCGLTISLMSVLSVLFLTADIFGVTISHRNYQKSLNYLFSSFSRISKGGVPSLIISLTGDEEVDSVITSYNGVVQNVVLLNEKVAKEENRALSLQVENANYSLSLLYSQINKHFIINVLSIIRSLITIKELDKANFAIENFSEFLRYSLSLERRSTLGEEINNAKSYLNIQTIRYPHTSVEFKLDGSLNSLPLPKVILQPILENCYVHGLQNGTGSILVHSYYKDGYAIIEVTNDSHLPLDERAVATVDESLQKNETQCGEEGAHDTKNHHIALSNIAKRLRLEHPGSSTHLEVVKGNRCRLSLRIPFQEEAKTC
jgi:two-component system sensor histidine kinase YesM